MTTPPPLVVVVDDDGSVPVIELDLGRDEEEEEGAAECLLRRSELLFTMAGRGVLEKL